MFNIHKNSLPRIGAMIRSYHSAYHPNIIIDPSKIENKLLTKSLEYVPQFGFSEKCISQAIKDLDYSDSVQSVLRAHSNGSNELQLMIHWLKSQRQKLVEEISDESSEFHKIGDEYDRATYLINKRLSYNTPIIGQLSGGIAHLIVPNNIMYSMEELSNLGDDIAFYAGDDSHDFAWYAKRFSIATAYVSSELYMLQDKSVDFKDTQKFVANKVKTIDQMGDTYETVEQWALFNGVSVFNLVKSQLARG